MSTSKTIESALFIPPEGVAQITGTVTYDGRYYEFLGEEEIGRYEDSVTGEVIPGKIVQKKGRLCQVVDDGNPTTPIVYEPYDGDEEAYKPIKRADSFAKNIQKYIVDGAFEGHPTEGEVK